MEHDISLHRYVARAQLVTYLKKSDDPRTRYGCTGTLFILAHSVDEALRQIKAFKYFDGGFEKSNGGTFFIVFSIAPHDLEIHGVIQLPSSGKPFRDALCKALMCFVPDFGEPLKVPGAET